VHKSLKTWNILGHQPEMTLCKHVGSAGDIREGNSPDPILDVWRERIKLFHARDVGSISHCLRPRNYYDLWMLTLHQLTNFCLATSLDTTEVNVRHRLHLLVTMVIFDIIYGKYQQFKYYYHLSNNNVQ